MNNFRAILHGREYTYSNESETRFGLVRVMKTSLCFAKTAKTGLATGVSLGLGFSFLLLGACEAVAQTQYSQTQYSVSSDALNSSLNSTVRVATVKEPLTPSPLTQTLDPQKREHSLRGNIARGDNANSLLSKEFVPPKKPNPREGTRGSGTRCLHNPLDRIFRNLL